MVREIMEELNQMQNNEIKALIDFIKVNHVTGESLCIYLDEITSLCETE